MKRNLLNLGNAFFLFITTLAFSSCDKDKDESDKDNTIDIIGIWVSGPATYNAKVGNETLSDYFINELGMSVWDAWDAFDNFMYTFKQDVGYSGSIKFTANHYESELSKETDSGTWSINSDSTELTLNSSSAGPTKMEVLNMSSDKMRLKILKSVSEDLNLDQNADTIDVEALVDFSKN
jgi:hypothetical protein